MMYIFLMDTGTMYSFDIQFAFKNVIDLQEGIKQRLSIPVNKQILLISGGQHLNQLNECVGKFGAGQDECNPIFLFNKVFINSDALSTTSVSALVTSGQVLSNKVATLLNLPASETTLVARVRLAADFLEVAKVDRDASLQLVRDQHLMHQGWQAAVANLDEIIDEHQSKFNDFLANSQEFLASRAQHTALLENFGSTRELLARVPVLPVLIAEHTANVLSTESAFSFTAAQSAEFTFSSSNMAAVQLCSLLDWIERHDKRNTLESLWLETKSAFSDLLVEQFEALAADCERLQQRSQEPGNREVGGIESRFLSLEEIVKLVEERFNEQKTIKEAFQANLDRILSERDTSVLPDLCASHKAQLQILLNNERQLRDKRQRLLSAKDEFAKNLHRRLRWLAQVQSSLSKLAERLVLKSEQLRRTRTNLQVLHQAAEAPRLYAMALSELYRRRRFARRYMAWSSALAVESAALHAVERQVRQDFVKHFRDHFLSSMFRVVLSKKMSEFATKAPETMDHALPEITPEDILLVANAALELKHLLPQEVIEKVASHRDSSSVSCEESFDRLNMHLAFGSFPTSFHDSPCERKGEILHQSQVTLLASADENEFETYTSQGYTTVSQPINITATAAVDPLEDNSFNSCSTGSAPVFLSSRAFMSDGDSNGFFTACFATSPTTAIDEKTDPSTSFFMTNDMNVVEEGESQFETTSPAQFNSHDDEKIRQKLAEAEQRLAEVELETGVMRQKVAEAYQLEQRALATEQRLAEVELETGIMRQKVAETGQLEQRALAAEQRLAEVELETGIMRQKEAEAGQLEQRALAAEQKLAEVELESGVMRQKAAEAGQLEQRALAAEQRLAEVELESGVMRQKLAEAGQLEQRALAAEQKLSEVELEIGVIRQKLAEADQLEQRALAAEQCVKNVLQDISMLRLKFSESAKDALKKVAELRSSFEKVRSASLRDAQELKNEFNHCFAELYREIVEKQILWQQSEKQYRTSMQIEHEFELEEAQIALKTAQERLNHLENDHERDMLELKTKLTAEKNWELNEAAKRDRTAHELAHKEYAQRQAQTLEQQRKELMQNSQLHFNEAFDKLRRDLEHKEIEWKAQLSLKDTLLAQQSLQLSSTSPISSPARICSLTRGTDTSDDLMTESAFPLGSVSVMASTSGAARTRYVTLALTSFKPGDQVLLYPSAERAQSSEYQQWCLFTVESEPYFLHSDCLQVLQTSLGPAKTRGFQPLLVEFVSREHCQARKEPNRFGLPLNAKFFRVRVRLRHQNDKL